MKDERIWHNRYQVTEDQERETEISGAKSEISALATAVICGFILAIAFILYLMKN